MTKKDRTVVALQYIEYAELNRRKYLNKKEYFIKKSTWFIYFIYQSIIEKLVPSFKLIDYMYNFYEMRSLIRSNTSCILPCNHRKLITLISFYYHQKNRGAFISYDEEFINKAKVLFVRKQI